MLNRPKKLKTATVVFMMLFFTAFSLKAYEQLMTKSFFDNWLRLETSSVEQRIENLKKDFSEMEKTLKEMQSTLFTEVKIIIGQKTAWLDGKETALDVAPVIKNDRTMVPVRFIGELFGASFEWDNEARKVSFILDGTNIELYIDRKNATVNNKTIELDTAPVIVDGRTLVPLRFVGEQMQASFTWDGEQRAVTIFR